MSKKPKIITEEIPKQIGGIFGTQRERTALYAAKHKYCGGRSLSMSDFILEHFGIRKAPGVTK